MKKCQDFQSPKYQLDKTAGGWDTYLFANPGRGGVRHICCHLRLILVVLYLLCIQPCGQNGYGFQCFFSGTGCLFSQSIQKSFSRSNSVYFYGIYSGIGSVFGGAQCLATTLNPPKTSCRTIARSSIYTLFFCSLLMLAL